MTELEQLPLTSFVFMLAVISEEFFEFNNTDADSPDSRAC